MASQSEGGYMRFTKPQRVDKAMHMLEGIVKGVALDGRVDEAEVRLLRDWCSEHASLVDRHPFNEVYPVVQQALADGVIDEEEREDILWLCERLVSDNEYFCAVTADMQRLQGLVAGVAADGAIEEGELRELSDWLDTHDHLRGCWPYDELDSLVMSVLQDGRIDKQEHEILLSFFSDFVALGEHRVIDTPLVQDSMLVFGVCAACPEVTFPGRLFCFTGKSTSAPRGALSQLVTDLGGNVSKSVTRSLDYLVVGADGNPCWAFACYGRKVEAAIQLRKAGERLLIVHENDFWDAVEDAK